MTQSTEVEKCSNKPMRGDVKKFKVYVKDPTGNVKKVNFDMAEVHEKVDKRP